MKNMLITASALGAAIAGLILYSQKKSKAGNRITDAAKNTYKTMNDSIGELERPAIHSMG